MMSVGVLVSVKNLTKVYGKNKLAVRALDMKSLDIRKGEFVAVTGPSGCGKTTLMNLLGGLDRPSSGDILFEGKNIAGWGEAALCKYRREKVGFIFQAHHLISTLCALNNVLAPAFPLGNGYKERARALLVMVGLGGKGHRLAGCPFRRGAAASGHCESASAGSGSDPGG